ncbi:YcxB family protein [Niabella ginsenosidivorans]|nr:YcxB family protein [Niabella ginsenosidivorans]
MKIVTGLMILTVLFSLLFPEIVKPDMPNVFLFPFIFLVVLPVFVYVASKRDFKNNRRMHEQVEYVFDDQNLVINGESFNMTMTWDKIFRVTKTKRWILFWQTRNMASLVPLKDISAGDMLLLKKILNERGVKNNL